MTYGLRIPANDKGAAFDTSSNVAGFALVDIIRLGRSSSLTKSYPDLVGFELHINEIAESGGYGMGVNPTNNVHRTTVDYTQGFPRITCSPAPSDAAWLIGAGSIITVYAT